MARFAHWGREFSAPLSVIQSELNKIFDEYWNPARFQAAQGSSVDRETSNWVPSIDLVETSDAYVLSVEVPGVDPGSIDLSLTGNTLNIRGFKPVEEGHQPSGAILERRFGPFSRQVVLPIEVDFEVTQAEARLGVLKIHLPKRESSKSRTIPVHSS